MNGDFRGPLPLDDRDFAEVRRNVMARLERRQVAIPLTLAAAAVVALIIVVLPRPTITVPPPHHVPVVVASAPAPQVAAQAPVKVARKEPVRKSAGAPPPDSEITMNIETNDPNIRIIWITR